MWHALHRRGAGSRPSFSLPTARPHYAPDQPFALEHLRLEVTVDPTARRIEGAVTLIGRPRQALSRLTLDAAELDVLGVEGPGGTTYEVHDPKMTLVLAAPHPAGEPLEVTVRYAGAPRRGLYFIGPSPFDPNRPIEVWTQGQDDDSRHWFPCFDHPGLKATSETIARVPLGLFALANGALLSDEVADGQRTLRYRHDTPHPSYLMTLVVGDYEAIEADADGVPVTSYVHAHQRQRAEVTFARTAEMVRTFAARTGVPYPYPRYSQIVVADFIFGGMENTTATSLTEHILFDEAQAEDVRPRAEGLIAHELAHQWWGDLVTCTDWAHAWLHEGFATYFEVIWREAADGPEAADHDRLKLLEGYLAEAYRRPLVARRYEEPIDLFDRHLYEKGALVLHALRRTLGDEAFFRGLAAYAEAHRAGSVDTHDLRRALLSATGRNLEALFDVLVFAPGHPELRVTGRWSADEGAYLLTVEQQQTGVGVPKVYPLEVDVRVAAPRGRDDEPVDHRLTLASRKQTFRLPAPARPRYVAFDRGGHLPGTVKLDLPAAELRALVEEDDDVRATIAAAGALARGGEPRSVEVALSALADHPRPEVRAEVAEALARLPRPEVKDALTDAVLQDGASLVRRAAIRALAHFTTDAEEISDFLIRHMAIERSDYALADTVATLATLGTEAGQHEVHRALERAGHNFCIRAAAVRGLARLRALDALPRVTVAGERDQHPRVREAAMTALGALAAYAPAASLARVETRERLERHLDDGWLRVRIRAAEALGHLGDAAARPALAAAIDRELDGRARRAMRLADARLGAAGPDAAQLDRLREDVATLRHAHEGMQDELRDLKRRGKAASGKGKGKKKRKKSD